MHMEIGRRIFRQRVETGDRDGDPLALRKEDVQAIADKYGVSKQDEAFTAELSDIYCRYVSSVIPPGSEELRGDEAETIIKFKNALGIYDPDAASMHMEKCTDKNYSSLYLMESSMTRMSSHWSRLRLCSVFPNKQWNQLMQIYASVYLKRLLRMQLLEEWMDMMLMSSKLLGRLLMVYV